MSLSNEFERLADLHQRGHLTDEEYSRAKARLLGQAEADAQQAKASKNSPSSPSPQQAGLGGAINRLQRSREDRWLGGVCGGLSQISGMAAWLWRLIFVLMLPCHGISAVVYLLLWALVPERPAPLPALEWNGGEQKQG